MSHLRSERIGAALLLGAAALGLLLANLPGIGAALVAFANWHPHVAIPGLDLSPKHWVSDGLLALFFFAVSVELRRELAVGELNSPRKAALPAIAALGGVIAPALVYVAIAGHDFSQGWPIPTATDIAFALGILGLFGRSIPNHVRVFLLALAVIDDLIAILIIAFFFTQSVQLPWLGGAASCLLVFAWMSRLLAPRSSYVLARRRQWPVVTVLWVLAVLTWWFVLMSGVHATIAGVALGFVIARQPGGRIRAMLEPVTNGIVLPLFAFAAAAVAFPTVGAGGLHAEFWAIVVALPLGKLIGIVIAGWVGGRALRTSSGVARSPVDLLMIGCLGGVGFTVSLLLNELAFRGSPEIADEGTLAVLTGSAFAIVCSAVFVALRSRHYGARGARG
ncbi:Na+/H+ antiporter NhaA [Gryllotalpicola protaetiae]|uniref:Na(+)/H(+) antiporter NhaA n=1 Tax=Gryllotalpicola protaetiae TaxID=2419771 RepID=A0A387C020_9MICO|nr:Na+/H+ antiporter NhaA [Gryllotalpicola protaetiae]AYG03921.1 Na+/H+ antiporter NhaA [Gryllotalpicola protaetiae]